MPRAAGPHFGVGWLSAAIIWAEIGDARRFSNSAQLVRFAGLDVTVYSSAGKRSPGHLSRQGSSELRWAAYEAAKCAARRASPDYAYYPQVAARPGNGKTPPWLWNASCCAAAITRFVSLVTAPWPCPAHRRR
jgi:hypothetical protein